MDNLKKFDQEIYQIYLGERDRQFTHIELIASENFVSNAVLEAQGSIFTNKYAEGYPNKRYYGGCEFVDKVEELAKNRLKKLFNCKYVNVQPHCGSSANMAAYRTLLKKGDTILGMHLDHGGHLTHGHQLNFSGSDYQFIFYGVNKDTERIDYDEVEAIAIQSRPQLIVAGASAYSRIIDFKRLKDIADKVNCYLMVDMAHIAGLVAAKLHPSPLFYADIVTSTTHKTLRGPRGGIILTNNEEIAAKMDKIVFPGIQGGPLMHVIMAKAVAFKEALSNEFIYYQEQVIKNAKALAEALIDFGFSVCSNGTDNHMLLVNVKKSCHLTGRDAEKILEKINITCNKNQVPFDCEKPFYTSGIRLGTPAVTTRGFKEKEMRQIALWINQALHNYQNEEMLQLIRKDVIKLNQQFLLPY